MGRLDTKTKEFWQDQEHFADLFNAVIFHGKSVIRPDQLREKDTEISTVLRKERKYLDTVFKTRDVVKKWVQGTEFVILGIEDQGLTDYSMPVRTMLYDALGYWKECQMISERNLKEKKNLTTEEHFSIGDDDRLHAIVTLCLYYGEDAWNGPRSLHDMLAPAPKEIMGLIQDYSLNLVEIRDSDSLEFHNSDVELVFSMVRKIYRKEIHNMEIQNVRRNLAEMIGIIVGSEKLVQIASQSDKEEIDMCRALEEMMEEKRIEGRIEGKMEGQIQAYYDVGFTQEQIAKKLQVTVSQVDEVLEGLALV